MFYQIYNKLSFIPLPLWLHFWCLFLKLLILFALDVKHLSHLLVALKDYINLIYWCFGWQEYFFLIFCNNLISQVIISHYINICQWYCLTYKNYFKMFLFYPRYFFIYFQFRFSNPSIAQNKYLLRKRAVGILPTGQNTTALPVNSIFISPLHDHPLPNAVPHIFFTWSWFGYCSLLTVAWWKLFNFYFCFHSFHFRQRSKLLTGECCH